MQPMCSISDKDGHCTLVVVFSYQWHTYRANWQAIINNNNNNNKKTWKITKAKANIDCKTNKFANGRL